MLKTNAISKLLAKREKGKNKGFPINPGSLDFTECG
jgi:hypothetical protein